MHELVRFIEQVFAAIPLPLLEVWGRLGFLIGFGLMLIAFTGITFRADGRWMLGRRRPQRWDGPAMASLLGTFVLVFATGYLGSFIVLVPGAQTFESLKDLSVFLCILLFGYPALVAVPFAYGLSDIVEGVPLDVLWDTLLGYFINPACFWLALLLIGRDPDFRKPRVWVRYLLFVAIFMSMEPQLWGYIYTDKFGAELAYGNITPALFFTTTITWLIAPAAMLFALPLARRCGCFWAEMPGRLRAAAVEKRRETAPLHLVFIVFFVSFTMLMVGGVAYLALSSGEHDARKLVGRLHQEMAANIRLQLDDHLAALAGQPQAQAGIGELLRGLPIARDGRAFVLDRGGRMIAASPAPAAEPDPVIAQFLQFLQSQPQPAQTLAALQEERRFRFPVITAKPLSRESWLAQASLYERQGQEDWIVITALPESYFLQGMRAGGSRSAMLTALALLLALALAWLLAAKLTLPMRKLAHAARVLAHGNHGQPVAGSRLEELDTLAQAFNAMAAQLQEHGERLKLATSAARLGIWDWDIVGDKLVWDEGMYAQFGIREEDFKGTAEAWEQCVLSEDRQAAWAKVSAALRGECEYENEFRVTTPDGSLRHIRGVARTLRDAGGRPLRMVGVNFDITERKLAEQELILHRDHLEQLVNERTAELRIAVERAQAANRAKSAFLANMSHELRTPLNAILGFAQLMQMDERLSPESARRIATINRAGEHLLDLINDVLEIARIEAGRSVLHNEVFELGELLAGVAELGKERAEAKGLRFEQDIALPLPLFLKHDGPRLRQILINLLGNAVKYTPRGTVNLLAARRGQELLFEVQDTGPGIAAEDQALVFDAFYQTGAGAAMGEGTGLGLAICREYAQLMDCRLGLRSELGRGSTFSLSLPLREAAAPPQPARALPAAGAWHLAPDQPAPRVLIVDDKADNREPLRQLLSAAGFDLREAANGQQAVELFQQWAPALIWMDMRMPVLDGYEATRQIRRLPGGARVKIVALTANAFEEDRQAILDAGCDELLRKPLEVERLFALMAELLGVRYGQEEQPSHG